MTDAYTYTPKPIGADYTNINPQGLQQYDQPNLTYDSPNVFYDSVNLNAYTNVPKPTGATTRAGMITGLLIPLTYAKINLLPDPYTYISKPT